MLIPDGAKIMPPISVELSRKALSVRENLGLDRTERLAANISTLRRRRGESVKVSRASAKWILDCYRYPLLREQVRSIEALLHTVQIEVVD